MYDVLSNGCTKVLTDSLVLTLNNNISLQATQSTTYTKLQTHGKTETYTTNGIMAFVQTRYTVVAPLQLGVDRTTAIVSTAAAPEYYDTWDAKLNNTTGDGSIAIGNNYGVDVAVFSNNATRDVELKGNCYVIYNLPGLSKTMIGNTLTVNPDGYKR